MTRDMLNTFQDYLVSKGLRMTSQREAIAHTFFQNRGHVSIEDIYRQVQKSAPGIGFATTYRTMNLLSEAGLAASRSFGDGFNRYEPAARTGHHDHLICTQCGQVIEFEDQRIEALQKTVARNHRFQVTDHKLELYGLCQDCQGPAR